VHLVVLLHQQLPDVMLHGWLLFARVSLHHAASLVVSDAREPSRMADDALAASHMLCCVLCCAQEPC
jgi:hypothetical protein